MPPAVSKLRKNLHEPDRLLAEVRGKWRTPGITYLPVRHHSPACAIRVRRWIAAHRPASVLVEGPSSFTPLIPHLVHPECRSPVAFYSYFRDKSNRLGAKTEAQHNPARFAGFYPMCDYSPEMVALRDGHAIGARLRFIDLDYAGKILARGPAPDDEPPRRELLADDPHLAHSRYLKELATRFGCRDFNEVWDHIFEAAFDLDDDAFIDRLLTYCTLARSEYSAEHLRADGTEAREACMAAAICDEADRNRAEGRTGPIVVVTGGFHTVVLSDLVAARPPAPKSIAFAADETASYLIRYSFDQLDALAGYASGMPSPEFYERQWHTEAAAEARTRLIGDWLVAFAQLSRDRQLATPLTTPDAIAALQIARQLAELRGHPWPLREDMLDSIRSCFVKGEIGIEGSPVMALVRDALAGRRIGQLPAGASLPPIVDDFHHHARRLRLAVEQVERRELALELYRNATHRQISRFLHQLDLLGVPFGSFIDGPDFVRGASLERVQELWRVCWSPATDGALIDAAVYGAAVEEAALGKLVEMIDQLEASGQGRNTDAAVSFLVRACRLGLHPRVAFLIPMIDRHIADDPAFASVVAGLSQLDLLGHAREPLEAMDLTELPALALAAYRRACKLLDDLTLCPDEGVDANLRGLRMLREVVVSAHEKNDAGLDTELFLAGLQRMVMAPIGPSQTALVGAAAGILFGEGRMSEEELLRLVAGYLGGVCEAKKITSFLRGLLTTAREVAWQLTSLLRAFDEQLGKWDQATFLAVLPDLRLAFTDLTPREILSVADQVANLHGADSLGDVVATDLEEAEVLLGLRLTDRVREVLKKDGLEAVSKPS
jgi:hypothetical protein